MLPWSQLVFANYNYLAINLQYYKELFRSMQNNWRGGSKILLFYFIIPFTTYKVYMYFLAWLYFISMTVTRSAFLCPSSRSVSEDSAGSEVWILINSLIFAGRRSDNVWPPQTVPAAVSKVRRQVVSGVREVREI